MEITIAKRFCGPPTSGNGGYSSGRVAALVGNPAEITLRAPPPLDAALRVERTDSVVRVMHGEADRPKKLKPLLDVQPPVLAVREDRLPLDVLHH